MPLFHHGSHFSTPAFVIWYLIRLEPFTSLHIDLQGGKFDHPARLFTSVKSTYTSIVSSGNSADVKELIPEFFCMPEFLRNGNRIDAFGEVGKGGAVVLPKWAETPEEFVAINRLALESPHVSGQLHNWIDLIFGYKSLPPYLRSGSQAR